MNNSIVGQRMKQRRTELGMTLEQIADEIGVERSTIQRYEKGKIVKIKLPVIEAIARVLRVSPSWLCGKTDSMDVLSGPPPPDTLTADIEQFARTLNTEQAAMLYSILTRVANAVRSTAEPPTPHDLTEEEMHAELSRQLAGERESREKGTGTSGSGLGSCGTG